MEEQPMQARELSFGEKAVGLTFNPSNNEAVNIIKQQSAVLIDTLNNLRSANSDPEVKRQASVAITEVQTAQMWGVKAATWVS